MKRALQIAFLPFAAAIVFFEQTIIRYLNMVMAAIASWPPIARLEARLVRLPPYGALLTFAAPSILILPVKLSAFWFGTHHRYGLALGSVILGKLLGTAILARLYRILQPTLMSIPWFAWADTHFFAWRDRAYAFVTSLPAWQKAQAMVQAARTRMTELVSALFAR